MLGAVCFLFLTLEVTLSGAEADEGLAWGEAAGWPGPGKGIVYPAAAGRPVPVGFVCQTDYPCPVGVSLP